MDSFLLAETFKYLYMIFAERDELIFDPDDYIFTVGAAHTPAIRTMLPYDAKCISSNIIVEQLYTKL
jgi:hypothetical protein